MEIMLTKKDIESVVNYMENGRLVAHMNDFGLSIGAMGFILTALSEKCEEILNQMEEVEDGAD